MTQAKDRLKVLVQSVLAVITVCTFPCVFQWAQNADEVPLRSMVPMLLVFLVVGGGAFLLALPILKKAGHAGFYTAIAMLLFCNLGMLSSALKSRFDWMHDRYLLIFCVILMLSLLMVLRRHKGFPGAELCIVITVAMSCMIAVSFARTVPTLYEIATTERKESGVDAGATFKSEARPNVYFIIADEYGGPENLKRYYDFDNDAILETLSRRGFCNSRTSQNLESISSWTLISNLLNLDYVANNSQPHITKTEYLDNPILFQLFRNNGYSVNLINHCGYIADTGCNVLTAPQVSDSIGAYIFENSILSMIPYLRGWAKVKLGISSGRSYVSELREAIELTKHCADYVDTAPTLSMIYLQAPHCPYVMDADGNTRYGGYYNAIDKYYYLDQLKWFNTVLDETTANIITEDPESIIILQSDHGSRYPLQIIRMGSQVEFDMEKETPYMQNVMNSVYFSGEEIDIEGLSGINTIRYVLNAAFGTDFPLLEAPTGYIASVDDLK